MFPVLPTPFDSSGEIDGAGFERVIDLFLAGGVNGLTALGVTGEVARLTEPERDTVLDTAVAHVNGRVPVGGRHSAVPTSLPIGCSIANRVEVASWTAA